MRRLNLPGNKHKGINIYCSKCNKYFSRTKKIKYPTDEKKDLPEPICGDSGKKFKTCSNFDKHKFKLRTHIPGTHNGVISKTVDTRNYNEAVINAIEFQNQSQEKFNVQDTHQVSTNKRIYLFDAQIEYLDFLDNVGVPEHQKVERSDAYIKEVKANFLLFNRTLNNNKIKIKILRLDQIEDLHVGLFHTFLLDEKRYANKTYNSKMGALRGFFKWAIKKYKLKTHNVFEDVRGRSVSRDVKTITKKEFYGLLDIIAPENGTLYLGGKSREKKNMYKPYLKDGIELCLHLGGRREEVVEVKWNMIYELEGKPSYIALDNLKVTRNKGEGFNDNVAPEIIPVTEGLMKVLNRLGYADKNGLDEHIICPDRSNINIDTIKNNLSRGFTHYYKQLNTGREIQLKHLRKTYLTYLNAAINGDTKKLSSHTTDEILAKHYIDERIVHKAVREVAIFG